MMTSSVPYKNQTKHSTNEENVEGEKCPIQPKFGDYQLIGDDLLMRFADQILQQRHEIVHGTRAVGYCVNGQRIEQLRQRVKLKPHPLSTKVMVLIGTNDILCGESIHTMIKHFNNLLSLLRKSVHQLLILTLPPIPKFCVTYYHWTLIRQYNTYLKSLDNGTSVVAADICPMFTKFLGALEYDMSGATPRVPAESVHHMKKRKSALGHRRRSVPERETTDKSESDYRNTTDTNTSVDSEVPSSEVSQDNVLGTRGQDSPDSCETTPAKPKRIPERVQSPVRFVVRTFQSVFGRDMLGRRKMKEALDEPERKARKSLMDLNEDSSDGWKVESDEDSMSEHVYKSQEEIEWDIAEVACQRKDGKGGEFSKFVESLNENEEARPTKAKTSSRRSKRDAGRNEKPEDTESSSSGDMTVPKKHMYPFVDDNFRCFLEKSCARGEVESSPESHVTKDCTESETHKTHKSRKPSQESRNVTNMEGVSERDKLILRLASKVCRLECYEIFHPFGKRRIDMIHLNQAGLMELKTFLISNKYVNI